MTSFDVRQTIRKTKNQPNPHDLLFSENSFNSFNPNPDDKSVGYNLFMNSTRTQLKDMTPQCN